MSGLWLEPAPLVLASKSRIRGQLLIEAGLPIEQKPSDVDERAVEALLTGDGATPASVAQTLAAAKATDVSVRLPNRLVVGADQTLSLGGKRFTKPMDREAGRAQLFELAGKTHVLASGVAICRDGAVLWSGVEEARLTVRALSEDFVEAYLDAAGDAVLTSVGGYQYEGLGAHLFNRVEGDYSTILGLPILPLLGALRGIGALKA